jgi:hypothetical protein
MGLSCDVPGDMVMAADVDAYIIQQCIELIERIRQGEDDPDLTALAHPELARALQELLATQRRNAREHQQLDRITARINAGFTLDDILENIYTDFCEIIPYNRIGLALLEDGGQTVSSRWNKSDYPIRLGATYRAPLAGSSLETVIATGQPRILNDLEDYLRHKPHSKSTRLLVAEGMVVPQVWCRGDQGGCKTRNRSRSKLARPYMMRLMTLRRLTCPSTWPLLQSKVRDARTAA